MTEDVKFIRGNDRINELAQRPDIAAGVAQVRADMAEADRTYAMGLAALRQAAELTQVELARRMGVTQAAISRIEQPHDLLLSTLASRHRKPEDAICKPAQTSEPNVLAFEWNIVLLT